MVRCDQCSKEIDDDEVLIHCKGCRSSYHTGCAPMKESTCKVKGKKDKDAWRCVKYRGGPKGGKKKGTDQDSYSGEDDLNVKEMFKAIQKDLKASNEQFQLIKALHDELKTVKKELHVKNTEIPSLKQMSEANDRPDTWASLMRIESERLKTFRGWPSAAVQPDDLAANGFYYTGKEDIVRCIYCNVELQEWELGDTPSQEHKRHSPNCDLVRGQASTTRAPDECGPFNHLIRLTSAPERGGFSLSAIESLPAELQRIGLTAASFPVEPRYSTEEARLQTFTYWPDSCPIPPKDMAQAGFYSIAFNDHVLCFHCGGGLRDWAEGDDPWVEHGRWFSRCYYVILHKGWEFVARVAEKNPPIMSAQAVMSLMEQKRIRNVPISSASSEAGPSSSSATSEAGPSSSNSLTEVVPSSSDPSTEVVPSSSDPSTEVVPSSSDPSTDVVPSSSVPSTEVVAFSSSSSVPAAASSSSTATEGLQNPEICMICLSDDRTVVLLPCGHFVSCVMCASALSSCPMCRAPVVAAVRAYLS